jgi:transforming growth factor-beta-induced protein
MLGGGYSVITVDGNTVRINDALITTVDIQASNGIIHVIDAVILPPGTITEIVVGNDNFDTLEAAVVEAELADDLGSEGPFTVFAPTDAAFDALIDALDTDAAGLLARPDLADILLYHVVSGAFGSNEVIGLDFAETLLGADVDFTVTPAGVRVNNANIVIADIPAANGVIHVIDAVLLPPAN